MKKYVTKPEKEFPILWRAVGPYLALTMSKPVRRLGGERVPSGDDTGDAFDSSAAGVGVDVDARALESAAPVTSRWQAPHTRDAFDDVSCGSDTFWLEHRLHRTCVAPIEISHHSSHQHLFLSSMSLVSFSSSNGFRFLNRSTIIKLNRVLLPPTN